MGKSHGPYYLKELELQVLLELARAARASNNVDFCLIGKIASLLFMNAEAKNVA